MGAEPLFDSFFLNLDEAGSEREADLFHVLLVGMDEGGDEDSSVLSAFDPRLSRFKIVGVGPDPVGAYANPVEVFEKHDIAEGGKLAAIDLKIEISLKKPGILMLDPVAAGIVEDVSCECHVLTRSPDDAIVIAVREEGEGLAITAVEIEFLSASAHEFAYILAEMFRDALFDMKDKMDMIGHDDEFISSDVVMHVVEGDYMLLYLFPKQCSICIGISERASDF